MNKLTLSKPHIMDAKPLLLAGISAALDEDAAYNIPLLWQKFSPFIGTIPQQVGQNCYGVCAANHANQHIYSYMAAVEVADALALPDVLSSMQVPAQRYAVFSHNDHISRIRDTIDAVFDEWLPQAQVRHANHVIHFIEHYSKDYKPETGLGGIEIWLPISR